MTATCDVPSRASDAGPEAEPEDWIDCTFEASDCLVLARRDRDVGQLKAAVEWLARAMERVSLYPSDIGGRKERTTNGV